MKKKIDKVMEIIYNDSNYKEIKEIDRDLDDSILTIIYKDNTAISRNDAESIIARYEEMEKEVERYIDDNNLTDYEEEDIKNILNHFNDYQDFFKIGSVELVELERFVSLVFESYKNSYEEY